jgi:hypothetical protein
MSAAAFAAPTVELDEIPRSPIVNHRDATFNRGRPNEFTVRAPWIRGSYIVKNRFHHPITVVAAEFSIYDNGSLIYDVKVDAPEKYVIVKPNQSFTFRNVYLDNLPKMFDTHVRYQIRYRVMGYFGTPDSPRSRLDIFTDFKTL